MNNKTNCGLFNTSKLKSKNRRMLNMKNKGKDMNKNKKDGRSYRSKCENPDVWFGYKKEAA